MADVRHRHAVSPFSRLPHSTLLPKHTPHASASQGLVSAVARSESSTHHEARDASPNGSMVASYKTGRGDGESTSQHSNEAHFQCLHDAAASKIRALVQLHEEIETSIEELSSVCLDAVPGQPSVPASFESCLASLRQDPASLREVISSAQHDWNTGWEFADYDLHRIQEATDRLEDRDRNAACTCEWCCDSNCIGEMRRNRMTRGLLGESGEAIKAAHGALRGLEVVHSTDELMHFEFFGPFWELSQV
jgi:hypothetical protein